MRCSSADHVLYLQSRGQVEAVPAGAVLERASSDLSTRHLSLETTDIGSCLTIECVEACVRLGCESSASGGGSANVLGGFVSIGTRSIVAGGVAAGSVVGRGVVARSVAARCVLTWVVVARSAGARSVIAWSGVVAVACWLGLASI